MSKITDISNNVFKIGDMVKVDTLYDSQEGGVGQYSQRYEDLFKEGKIDFVFGNDENGGYVYGIEGCKWTFSKFELIPLTTE